MSTHWGICRWHFQNLQTVFYISGIPVFRLMLVPPCWPQRAARCGGRCSPQSAPMSMGSFLVCLQFLLSYYLPGESKFFPLARGDLFHIRWWRMRMFAFIGIFCPLCRNITSPSASSHNGPTLMYFPQFGLFTINTTCRTFSAHWQGWILPAKHGPLCFSFPSSRSSSKWWKTSLNILYVVFWIPFSDAVQATA